MRESISALESAVAELVQARDVLPDELATQLDPIIAEARELVQTLRLRSDDSASSDAEQEVG